MIIAPRAGDSFLIWIKVRAESTQGLRQASSFKELRQSSSFKYLRQQVEQEVDSLARKISNISVPVSYRLSSMNLLYGNLTQTGWLAVNKANNATARTPIASYRCDSAFTSSLILVHLNSCLLPHISYLYYPKYSLRLLSDLGGIRTVRLLSFAFPLLGTIVVILSFFAILRANASGSEPGCSVVPPARGALQPGRNRYLLL